MLVLKLIERQRELNMVDAEFANELNISGCYWNSLRHGYSRPGLRLLRGVAKRFPELVNGDDESPAVYPKGPVVPKAGRKRMSKVLRERRKEIDGQCRLCGSQQELRSHHLDLHGPRHDSPNDALVNLITLCHKCHNALHVALRVTMAWRRLEDLPEVPVDYSPVRGVPGPKQRLMDMARRHYAGEPLESIAVSYGLSRQRVQQLLQKSLPENEWRRNKQRTA